VVFTTQMLPSSSNLYSFPRKYLSPKGMRCAHKNSESFQNLRRDLPNLLKEVTETKESIHFFDPTASYVGTQMFQHKELPLTTYHDIEPSMLQNVSKQLFPDEAKSKEQTYIHTGDMEHSAKDSESVSVEDKDDGDENSMDKAVELQFDLAMEDEPQNEPIPSKPPTSNHPKDTKTSQDNQTLKPQVCGSS
jgi:hypothetical protein